MSLKKAYLYLVSVISLIIVVIGAIMLINLALRTWVFTKADRLDYFSAPCISSKAPTPDGRTVPCTQEEEEQQRKDAQERRTAQKQRDAAQAIAMIVVATPVWWGHWRLAKREQ